MISYAQNFEDVLLMRVFKDLKCGLYIDIGANHPVLDSVSLAFYERGWRGVHVEPMPEFAKALRDMRPDEVVFEAAVSTTSTSLELVLFEGTGLTTGVEEHANRHIKAGLKSERFKVQTVSLAYLFDQHVDSQIHWVKIDVEGMETEVLQSWGDSEVRPWVLIVESTLPNSQIQSFAVWEHLIEARGYRFAYFDGLNRYYVHEAHKELITTLALQPNVFDEFQIPQTSGFAKNLAAQIRDLSTSESALRAQLEGQAQQFTVALQRALDAQAIEASDNRVRLDAALRAAQREISDVNARLHEALSERDAANVKVHKTHLQLQSTLESQHEFIRQCEANAAALMSERTKNEARREWLERSLSASERARSTLLTELAALRRARDEAEVARHRQLDDQAAEFRGSLSWRVTAPLRGASAAARFGARGARAAARRLLDSGLALVRGNPWMKRSVLAAVSVSPALKARLLSYGQRHAPDGVPSPAAPVRFILTPDPDVVAEWATALDLVSKTKNPERAA